MVTESETIFALSSGKGKAGVAVIRISGEDVASIFESFSIKKPQARLASLQKIKNPNTSEIIDNCLILYFNAPNSFTGEETVELHLHGSIAVVQEVLDVLENISNFRLAEAGEFSKRAFENGKMDLVQAEGLADLIESETTAQKNQAIRQIEGKLSDIYENLREQIIEIMAFIEAFVDFPDEDIPDDLDNQAQEKVSNIIQKINSLINNNRGEKLRSGAVAAIIGAPNAGKSTLLNYLSERDVAIVSDIAGTTRDSIEVHLNISGYPLTIIDTAGIRETEDIIEKEGVKRAIEKAENADFKIILFDSSKEIDANILSLKQDDDILVLTKSDISVEGKSKLKNAIEISVKDEIYLDILLQKLSDKLAKLMDTKEDVLVTRSRHKSELKNTVKVLQEFMDSRIHKESIELCAEHLRAATYHLGKITGKIGVEDLLDKIFSDFCIGK